MARAPRSTEPLRRHSLPVRIGLGRVGHPEGISPAFRAEPPRRYRVPRDRPRRPRRVVVAHHADDTIAPGQHACHREPRAVAFVEDLGIRTSARIVCSGARGPGTVPPSQGRRHRFQGAFMLPGLKWWVRWGDWLGYGPRSDHQPMSFSEAREPISGAPPSRSDDGWQRRAVLARAHAARSGSRVRHSRR